MASFNGSVTDYEALLHEIRATGNVELVDDNFDTGTVTKPGEYPLADKTYADLLDRQSKDHFAATSPELRTTILRFYSDTNAPIVTKKNPQQWAKVLQQLDELKAVSIAQSNAPAAGSPPSMQ
jgi:hypothetical protein